MERKRETECKRNLYKCVCLFMASSFTVRLCLFSVRLCLFSVRLRLFSDRLCLFYCLSHGDLSEKPRKLGWELPIGEITKFSVVYNC